MVGRPHAVRGMWLDRENKPMTAGFMTVDFRLAESRTGLRSIRFTAMFLSDNSSPRTVTRFCEAVIADIPDVVMVMDIRVHNVCLEGFVPTIENTFCRAASSNGHTYTMAGALPSVLVMVRQPHGPVSGAARLPPSVIADRRHIEQGLQGSSDGPKVKVRTFEEFMLSVWLGEGGARSAEALQRRQHIQRERQHRSSGRTRSD